jgi:hypothetical protein
MGQVDRRVAALLAMTKGGAWALPIFALGFQAGLGGLLFAFHELEEMSG